MMANWGTIMFLLFVIPLSWFIEVMAKGHHHVPSLRHSLIMVHRGKSGHDGQVGNHHVPALRHSIIVVHRGKMAMMANWGTIMFLLFVIPLSWFIEVMAKGHHHVPSLVIPLLWFIEVRVAMMANWGIILFLLFVIPLSWFIEVRCP
jgi:hypothetical protein